MNRPVRIGMIVPSSNTVVEPVTQRLAVQLDAINLHATRIPVTRIELGEKSDAQFDTASMLTCGRLLADAQVDVLIWNGTSGSWRGIDVDEDLVAALREATGVEATTSTLALLAACRAFDVTRLGLVTPYTADVNRRIAEVYAGAGIRITADSALGIVDNFAFASVTPQVISEQVRSVAASSRAVVDAVAIVCTNLDAAAIVPRLEGELGIPVFDSVAASVWHAAHLAGRMVSVADGGRLLRDGSLRSALHDICAQLRDAVGADRVTVRLDDAPHGFHVDLTAAESRAPSVPSIAREAGLDQRALETVRWLDSASTNLVQPRFTEAPFPPQALIDVYGVKAQMLGAIRSGGALIGWVSAHSLSERDWSLEDSSALTAATAQVRELLS